MSSIAPSQLKSIQASILLNGTEAEGGSAGGDNRQDFIGAGGQTVNPSAPYFKTLDNVSGWLQNTCDRETGFFVWGECENGHAVAKELVCAKDWCQVCGKKGSTAHMRRVARWVPKVRQIAVMGKIVFTLPDELIPNYRERRQEKRRGDLRRVHPLTTLGHDIQELLKAFGFPRGLRRWHFKGDKSPRYRPHLETIFDAPAPVMVPCKAKPVSVCPVVLDAIKYEYASLLGIKCDSLIEAGHKADVKFEYRTQPGRKWHGLTYACRPTYHDYEEDPIAALAIRDMRNMVAWGRGLWAQPAVWSLAMLHGKARKEAAALDSKAIAALAEHKCPCCGKTIVWHEALPIKMLGLRDKMPLGAGYYRLKDIPPGPELPDDIATNLWQMEYIQTLTKKRVNLTHLGMEQRHQSFYARRVEAGANKRLADEAWADLLNYGGWRDIPAPEDVLDAPGGRMANNA